MSKHHYCWTVAQTVACPLVFLSYYKGLCLETQKKQFNHMSYKALDYTLWLF